MTTCVMVRECKESSAPGEVPEEVFSDGGSTPPASTKIVPAFVCCDKSGNDVIFGKMSIISELRALGWEAATVKPVFCTKIERPLSVFQKQKEGVFFVHILHIYIYIFVHLPNSQAFDEECLAKIWFP